MREDAQNFLQPLAHLFELRLAGGRRCERQRFLLAPGFRAQMLASARNGETFVIQQFFDAQHVLHVQPAIHALPGAAFRRLELGKFALPKTQNITG